MCPSVTCTGVSYYKNMVPWARKSYTGHFRSLVEVRQQLSTGYVQGWILILFSPVNCQGPWSELGSATTSLFRTWLRSRTWWLAVTTKPSMVIKLNIYISLNALWQHSQGWVDTLHPHQELALIFQFIKKLTSVFANSSTQTTQTNLAAGQSTETNMSLPYV